MLKRERNSVIAQINYEYSEFAKVVIKDDENRYIDKSDLRIELSFERLQIRINDIWHDVTQQEAKMLRILIDAKGAWVGGKSIFGRQGRPDKVKRKMSQKVGEIIETHQQNGYRIKPEIFRKGAV